MQAKIGVTTGSNHPEAFTPKGLNIKAQGREAPLGKVDSAKSYPNGVT